MARIMISVRGEKSGEAVIADFPDSIPLATGINMLFTRLAADKPPASEDRRAAQDPAASPEEK